MSDESDDKLFLNEKDCAIVISEEGEMSVILPKLNEDETPSESVSESVFLISFLSHAITRQDWIDEYMNRFENNFELIASQFINQFGTDLELAAEDNVKDEEEIEVKKEINFAEEMGKFQKNKPKIIT